MSMIAEEEPQDLPRVPPAEVSSLMAAWWLVIVFSLLVYLAILPMAPSPLADKDSLTQTGWLTFGGLALVLLVVGGFVGAGMRRGKPGSLKLCKLALLLAIVIEVGAVAGVLVLASGKPAPAAATPAPPAAASSSMPIPIGPSPVLGIILLVVVVLLPICFSILTFSLSSAMGVKDWFYPPEEEQVGEAAGAGLEGAGTGAAVFAPGARAALEEAPVGLEAAPMEHLEAETAPAPRPSFEATVPPELGPQPMGEVDFGATVPPELGPQPVVSGKSTMIASEEDVSGAVHAESDEGSLMHAEVEPSSSSLLPPATPEETPVDHLEAEAEFHEEHAPVRDAGSAGEPAAEAVEEIVEYVVEDADTDAEVVEEVVEEVEELPSAEADAGDGTDLKPVETWDFLEEDEDKGGKKKK
jgi:hypothetical protein